MIHVRRLLAGASVAALATRVLLASPPVAAQTAAPVKQVKWDPGVDIAVTAGGLAAWVASELLKADLAPAACRWCAADGADVAARSGLVWKDTEAAATLSNVTGFVLVPLAAIALDALAAANDGAGANLPEDVLLTAEAGVIAADVNQIAKFLVGRERPFVHALPPDEKPLTAHPADNDVSFFSGHTTESFALATASGVIGELHGYRWAPLAWGVGGALAATTAYLRIAADRHWLTDTLVGLLVGVGIGVAVPCLFHPAQDGASDTTRGAVSSALRVPPASAPVPTLSFVW